RGYLFESNRGDKYTPRYIQLVVHQAATQAGSAQQVTPHRLRASGATILLDAGMPREHVQKFLRHKRLARTQIYAETSLRGLGDTYVRVCAQRSGAPVRSTPAQPYRVAPSLAASGAVAPSLPRRGPACLQR